MLVSIFVFSSLIYRINEKHCPFITKMILLIFAWMCANVTPCQIVSDFINEGLNVKISG